MKHLNKLPELKEKSPAAEFREISCIKYQKCKMQIFSNLYGHEKAIGFILADNSLGACKSWNPDSGIRKRNRTNKWMIQVVEVWLTSMRLLPSLCKIDDDIRIPFKKRYKYKEHNRYHYGIRNSESAIPNRNPGKRGNNESSSAVKSFWIQDSVSSILSIWDTISTLSNWETGLKKISDCRSSDWVYGDCN